MSEGKNDFWLRERVSARLLWVGCSSLLRFLAPLGLLLSIVTKRSVESPDYMRPFTPYFHCDCVKNARNGATIAVLFSLPQQKYNAKFSHKSKLPTLAQKDFFGTAQEGIKMTALRGKSRISLPLRLQLSCAKAHLAFGRRFHLQT